MSDEHDALELELESMRPRELSSEVRRRICHSLARDTWSPRNMRWWWGGLVAAAACVAIALMAWHARPSRDTDPGRMLPPDRELVSAPIPDATLGSYKMAFARSPERFDALLDKQAARPLVTTDGDSRTYRPFDLNLIP